MADLLVKLYDLPPLAPALDLLTDRGVKIRRAAAAEKSAVTAWVKTRFGAVWASECEASFARLPVACFLAVNAKGALAGFACYEATCRGFFGPTGVAKAARNRGIGRALLLATLHAMRAEGYAYAIIGGVGPAEYYIRQVGAIEIPGSTPGIYSPRLRGK